MDLDLKRTVDTIFKKNIYKLMTQRYKMIFKNIFQRKL